jgi:diguanylate cyclase (GGDEF)-like protein
VLDLLSRLAGAALENLQLRVNAEQRAETDPLTGLKNRFYLDKVLELEIPRVKRYNQPLSLLVIDLREFKKTNDAYGHPFGDFILRETARLLLDNVRKPDFVIRLGGDEFVVLMVNTRAEQAELVRERIERAFIERNRMQTDEKMVIRISIGLRSADAGNIEALIYEADMAMYAHKARQKRRVLLHALLRGEPEVVEMADKVVGSLCSMLWRKAPGSADHARRVAHLALVIGRRLGLPSDELETLALAGLLHDVGLVSLPAEVLVKTAPLSVTELQALRHHPALGEEFFQGIDYLEPVRPLIRHHHERYDGSQQGNHPGYPDGLSGEHIPLGARILKLSEAVDAMLHSASPRETGHAGSLEKRLESEEGGSFDPRLVRAMLSETEWRGESLGGSDAIIGLLELDEE